MNDGPEKIPRLYVEVGIEGKGTHEWRDTLAIEVLEGGGSREDVQLLRGHKSRKATEKYYVALTKKRTEKAIEARRNTMGCGFDCAGPFVSLRAERNAYAFCLAEVSPGFAIGGMPWFFADSMTNPATILVAGAVPGRTQTTSLMN